MSSAAAKMATGMTDSAGSRTCGEKMGGEESSKILDNRADCPDAEYDDTADHTEPSNTNGTITDQKQGEPRTQDKTAAITRNRQNV